MPSKSKAQAKLMQAAAHSKEFAAKVKVPQKVAREFYAADRRKSSSKQAKSGKK
jgi:hypothetical protein